MRCLLIPSLALAAFLSAGASQSRSTSQPLSPREHVLVGTWRSAPGSDQWVVTRRADRSFTEERTTDYPAPGTHYTSTGTWHVAGNSYYTRYLSVTDPSARKLIGRDHRAYIHSL